MRRANLIHVLLDNGVHDSTGGQADRLGSVDFAARRPGLRLPLRRLVRHVGRVRAGLSKGARHGGPQPDSYADRPGLHGHAGQAHGEARGRGAPLQSLSSQPYEPEAAA